MKDMLVGIYGMSGFGREVMPLARELTKKFETKVKLVFIDDNSGAASSINGHDVLSYKDFIHYPCQTKKVSIAIANSKVREELSIQLQKDGIEHLLLKSSKSVSMDEVEMQEGAIICPFVTLTSNIKIGRHFHANLYSYVAHDCVIGDYVTFAPNVCCNGNVHIEDHAYIGTGAIIKQGTPEKPVVIGRGAIVGMGAVVTKDVAPGSVVVGNPAKPFSK